MMSPQKLEDNALNWRAAICGAWSLVAGPSALLYFVWILVVERTFPKWEWSLVLSILLGIHSLGLYLIGYPWIRRRSVWFWAGLVVLGITVGQGPGILWCALLGVLTLAGLAMPAPKKTYSSRLFVLLAVSATPLYVLTNQHYLLRGAFYTWDAGNPPRVMPSQKYECQIPGQRLVPGSVSEGRSIAFLGDSVMWGFPYPAVDSIPAQVVDLLRGRGHLIRAINFSMPSQTMLSMHALLPEILEANPESVVVMTGYQFRRSQEFQIRLSEGLRPAPERTDWVPVPPFVIDVLTAGYVTFFEKPKWETFPMTNDQQQQLTISALQEFVVRLRDQGINVIVVQHPALQLDTGLDEKIRYVSENGSVGFVPTRDLFLTKEQYALNDGIHPTRAGLELIAERIVLSLDSQRAEGFQ